MAQGTQSKSAQEWEKNCSSQITCLCLAKSLGHNKTDAHCMWEQINRGILIWNEQQQWASLEGTYGTYRSVGCLSVGLKTKHDVRSLVTSWNALRVVYCDKLCKCFCPHEPLGGLKAECAILMWAALKWTVYVPYIMKNQCRI